MFELNNETNLYWIKGDSFELPLKFELIGIMLGLAIFMAALFVPYLALSMM